MRVKFFQDNKSDNNHQKSEWQNPEWTIDKTALLLTSRQISWIISGFLLLSFFVFMAGYFLGQRKVVADFTCKVEQESLGDIIFSSLYSSYNIKDPIDSADEEASSETVAISDEGVLPDIVQSESILVAQDIQEVEELSVNDSLLNNEPVTRYYAELIGFGTAKAAKTFVDRLQKDGISVDIKKRTSKTSQGKQVAWYQVVTEQFDETTTLFDLVKKIEKKEHLKGVSIQTCS